MKQIIQYRPVTIMLVLAVLSIAILACATPAVPQKTPAAVPSQLSTPAASPAGSTIDANFGLKAISSQNGIQLVPVEIPVSDGRKLAADIYIPEKGGPFPAILIQTPYNKDLFRPVFPYELASQKIPEGAVTALGQAAGGSGSFIHSTDFVIVASDWRGRFGSKNAATGPGVGTAEQRRQDGYDTVEWIAAQPWCNGKVGMWGSSALGQIQWETAAKRPPHLVCMVPRVSDYAQNYGKYYCGGVVRREYMDGLAAAGWGALADIVMAHPTDDGFYTGKDTADPREIKTPALVIGGWWDIHDTPKMYNAVLSLVDSETARNMRMLICPSSHTNIARDGPEGELDFPGAGAYTRNEQKKFFDYWLRGVDNGFSSAALITYYQMGSNEWRTATQWPPSDIRETSYYLNVGGMLTATASTQGIAARQFSFNPNSPVPTDGGNTFKPGIARGPIDQSKIVERHRDVLIFTSDVLVEDVAIAGDISATLYVSSDAVDTDVAIRVTDVYPDGRSMLVRDGIQRLSHLEGDKTEKFITPGAVYPVTVKTCSVGQTFVKGHRIRLIVSASNYPRFGMNNGQEDRSKSPIKITNTLYFDAKHPSALVLPVVPK